MKFRLVLSAVLGISALTATGCQAATVADTAASDLLRAADAGDVPLLQSALKRGAPLEIRDSQYLFTPLAWAAWKGNLKAVDVLLAAGANTEAHSVGGALLPITLNTEKLGPLQSVESSDETPLSLAILGSTPHSTAVALHLLKHGANPNTSNVGGYTPFHFAAFMAAPSVVDACLAHGANPNAMDKIGFFSPLTAAVAHMGGEDVKLVQKLLAAGANPNQLFLGRPLEVLAHLANRPRTAALIVAARKRRLEEQKRIAAQPAILYPDSSDEPTFVE